MEVHGMERFELVSEYAPAGDQPEAIDVLVAGIENGLTDILINRNELYGFRIAGTGTNSGTGATLPPRTSSTRKYICPCCGNSVRATKTVNIACLDCAEQMVLAG